MTDNPYLIPPRRGEHNLVTKDSNITYNSDPIKGWPELGTDSSKRPKIGPELQPDTVTTCGQSKSLHQNQMDSSLAELIEAWSALPEHIKQTITSIIRSTSK